MQFSELLLLFAISFMRKSVIFTQSEKLCDYISHHRIHVESLKSHIERLFEVRNSKFGSKCERNKMVHQADYFQSTGGWWFLLFSHFISVWQNYKENSFQLFQYVRTWRNLYIRLKFVLNTRQIEMFNIDIFHMRRWSVSGEMKAWNKNKKKSWQFMACDGFDLF